MKNTNPIERLHKLLEVKFERYKYYKDKYTRELFNADMPDDRRGVQHGFVHF